MSQDESTQLEEAPAQPPNRLLSLLCAGGAGGAVEIATAIGHMGVPGMLALGGVGAVVAWQYGPDALNWLRPQASQQEEEEPVAPAPVILDDRPLPKQPRTIMQRAMGVHPAPPPPALDRPGAAVEGSAYAVDDVEQAFASALSGPANVPPVPRLTIAQIVEHTAPNSYEAYIGRSLTRSGYPAVKINFYKRHIKLLGASQHGKSSMAAAFLEAILKTHNPEYVQVALLDLENKTSRLFARCPHLVQVDLQDGRHIRLHARNHHEVLVHLEYLLQIITWRYTLSEEEIERLPVIIVYLEEFIDLKDYFKQRIDMVEKEERARALREYERLIFCIKHIARRGLKVLVQLLLSTQVDYRDEELQEALVNVTSGMAFCLRRSAAQAAGFNQLELLKQNATDNQVGQAVVEMPECKDLVLAPEYDLAARLRALSFQESQRRGGYSSRSQSEPRKLFPEVPSPTGMPSLSSHMRQAGTSREVPQDEADEPLEQTEDVPGEFRPRNGDLLLSEVQASQLLALYPHCNNVNETLSQIRNERGQGLGARYFRHASFLLEQQGLKKRRA